MYLFLAVAVVLICNAQWYLHPSQKLCAQASTRKTLFVPNQSVASLFIECWVFWNQEGMEAEKEMLCGTDEFWEDGPHSVPCVAAPKVFSRNQGLLGTPIFLIFAIVTSCKLLIFTCACSTIKTTVPHCKGRLYDSDHSSVRQKGVEHKGINALITTESSFPMIIFSVVAGFPRLGKCYSVS